MDNNLQTVTGRIESASAIKSGTSNGRDWTLVKVVIDGNDFTTFDSNYLGNVGTSGTFYFQKKVTEKNGREYTSYELKPIDFQPGMSSAYGRPRYGSQPQHAQPSQPQHDAVAAELKEMNRLLHQIIDKLDNRMDLESAAEQQQDDNSLPF